MNVRSLLLQLNKFASEESGVEGLPLDDYDDDIGMCLDDDDEVIHVKAIKV